MPFVFKFIGGGPLFFLGTGVELLLKGVKKIRVYAVS